MKTDSLRLAPEVSGKESSEPTGQKAGGLGGGASQYTVKAKCLYYLRRESNGDSSVK